MNFGRILFYLVYFASMTPSFFHFSFSPHFAFFHPSASQKQKYEHPKFLQGIVFVWVLIQYHVKFRIPSDDRDQVTPCDYLQITQSQYLGQIFQQLVFKKDETEAEQNIAVGELKQLCTFLFTGRVPVDCALTFCKFQSIPGFNPFLILPRFNPQHFGIGSSSKPKHCAL